MKIEGKYVVPETSNFEEIDVKMWTNGITGYGYTDKSLAVYACATGRVCTDCGEAFEGLTYTVCPACRKKKLDKKYNSLEVVEWDGETPLAIFEGEHFFFSEDDIEYYLDDLDEDESIQLVLCEKEPFSTFCISDCVEDMLPEDYTLEDLENKSQKLLSSDIENIVNAYLKTLSPVWRPSNKRVVYPFKVVL